MSSKKLSPKQLDKCGDALGAELLRSGGGMGLQSADPRSTVEVLLWIDDFAAELDTLVSNGDVKILERGSNISWARVRVRRNALHKVLDQDSIRAMDLDRVDVELTPATTAPGPNQPIDRAFLCETLKASVGQRGDGKGVRIGCSDSQCRTDNPDFAGSRKRIETFDATAGEGSREYPGHGTAVASLTHSTEAKAPGLCPGSHLFHSTIFKPSTTLSWILRSVDWEVSKQVHLSHKSWGGAGRIPVLEAALKAAFDANIVLFASAGNNGNGDGSRSTIGFPGAYSFVIATGAICRDGSVAVFSSTGAKGDGKPNLVNFGHRIQMAGFYGMGDRLQHPDGRVECIASGTSFSDPLAAGIAALIMQELLERGIKWRSATFFEEYLAPRCETVKRPTGWLRRLLAS